ncbi:STAS/SEC14 domain-containing protein [Methylobacterium sp. E-005]|uniref:STAS/SEC14 domain-containing protein n=1 Tax=Methylobacterium sp. E-005 TaxID=2836549 RepID=UPI001FBA36F9|nr:STAS/SEC14 domain-containing protein [Methylobacterium sp. E-005]MCJ2085480.1 STAS/SEC14 domain-containing protein [Methylobacterium sp. E-005]
MNAAPDGSVAQRQSPRPDLLAFEIKDKVTKDDIEWMSAITDEVMKLHDKIDMLIIMSNYEGSELAASFDSYANSVKARSVAHINRYVVVGAPTLAKAMINLSGLVLPVESKTFDLKDEAAAWDYLAQKPSAAV